MRVRPHEPGQLGRKLFTGVVGADVTALLWRVISGESDDKLGGNPDLAVIFLGDFLEESLVLCWSSTLG